MLCCQVHVYYADYTVHLVISFVAAPRSNGWLPCAPLLFATSSSKTQLCGGNGNGAVQLLFEYSSLELLLDSSFP